MSFVYGDMLLFTACLCSSFSSSVACLDSGFDFVKLESKWYYILTAIFDDFLPRILDFLESAPADTLELPLRLTR